MNVSYWPCQESSEWDTAPAKFNILKPHPYWGRGRSNSTSEDKLTPWPHSKEFQMGNNIVSKVHIL